MRPEVLEKLNEQFDVYDRTEQFVEMFCKVHKCKSTATVYRIEFEHVGWGD